MKRYKLHDEVAITGGVEVEVLHGMARDDDRYDVKLPGGTIVTVPTRWLVELPPPIPAEPPPGAYLIGGVLCVRVSIKPAKCWVVCEDDMFDEQTFAKFWPRLGGSDISIVSLVPKADLPEVTLPWSNGKDPLALHVEISGDRRKVHLGWSSHGYLMSPSTALELANALTAAGHKAIEEATA